MADKHLYATVTGTSDIEAINISQSHDAAVATANVTAVSTSLDVGDSITINIGYTGDSGQVFAGYVKRVEKSTPDGRYSIVANDVLTRAVDYFIASTDPTSPLTFNNITCEDLIQAVLEEAGLSNFDFGTTYFTFGINNPVEVNLVSAYDYSRMLADIVAWSFWAEQNGVIKFKNRKPYPMNGALDGEDSQPGYVYDSSIGTITDTGIMSANFGYNESDLRNRIVIYGNSDLSAEAKKATSYDPVTDSYRQILPSGFYKTAVLASPLIDDSGFAQNAADYNLSMLNKLTYEVPVTIEGDHSLSARKVITVSSTSASISGDWYIYQLEHQWNKQGYVVNMILRK